MDYTSFDHRKDGDQFFFPPQETGKEPQKCLVNSVPVTCVRLRHTEADHVARWNQIMKELELAEAQLTELLKRSYNGPANLDSRDTEGMIRKALFDSAIISYCKCFAEAEGRRVKLESKTVFKGSEGEALVDHHVELKNLRNQYLAHAGVNKFEVAQTFAIRDPNPAPGVSPNCVIAHASFRMPGLDFTRATLATVVFVKRFVEVRVRGKLNEIARKVEADPKAFGVENLFRPRSR